MGSATVVTGGGLSFLVMIGRVACRLVKKGGQMKLRGGVVVGGVGMFSAVIEAHCPMFIACSCRHF